MQVRGDRRKNEGVVETSADEMHQIIWLSARLFLIIVSLTEKHNFNVKTLMI